MKKLILITALFFILTISAYAMTVSYITTSNWGGAYTVNQITMDDISRDNLTTILDDPAKSYGYCDIWNNDDQIYIAYFDAYGNPTTVVILPVTSW